MIAKSFRVFPDATLTGLLRVTGVDEADAAEDGGVLVSVPHLGGGASALPRGTLLRLWHAAFHPRSLPPLPQRTGQADLQELPGLALQRNGH